MSSLQAVTPVTLRPCGHLSAGFPTPVLGRGRKPTPLRVTFGSIVLIIAPLGGHPSRGGVEAVSTGMPRTGRPWSS